MKNTANDNDRLVAAQYVRKQLKQLAGQLDLIRRAEDVEAVHRARVALRRLRAALRWFRGCFAKKDRRRWRKQIRRLARQLGQARDRDVQIQFVEGLLRRLDNPACYPGVARLLVHLEHERESLQRGVLEALTQWETSRTLEQIEAAARSLMPGSAIASSDGREGALRGHASEQILDRLEEFLAHQHCLAQPDACRQHHAMRIAAKRLRYTMEICQPCYDLALEEFITAAKEVQRLLGEIHDCDVWSEQLDEFLRQQRAWIVKRYGHDRPLARLRTGIDYVREDRRRHRGDLFQQLLRYWEDLGQRHLWGRLMEMVCAAGGCRPDSPGAAASQREDHSGASAGP